MQCRAGFAALAYGKGQASYLSLMINGELTPDAVWFYPDPKPEADMVRGRVAFWKTVKVA